MVTKKFMLFLAFCAAVVGGIFLAEAQISRDRPISEAAFVDSTGTNWLRVVDGSCALSIQRGATTSTGLTTNKSVIIPGSTTNTLVIVGGLITAIQ